MNFVIIAARWQEEEEENGMSKQMQSLSINEAMSGDFTVGARVFNSAASFYPRSRKL